MNVQNKVKEFGISSLSGWEIAEFFKCGYMGDMNPIDHDGCYYDTRDWKEHGYANCVDFCRIADDDDALTVECGTINKPDDMTGSRAVGPKRDNRRLEMTEIRRQTFLSVLRESGGNFAAASRAATPHSQASRTAPGYSSFKRLYTAVVWGHLPNDSVTIDAPIGRHEKDRKRMTVTEEGRPAVTRVKVRERWQRADVLDVALQTGRTHQIRVHMAHIGHPVVADEVYGLGWERGLGGPTRRWVDELARRTRRQFLHAAQLVFDHPVTGERMSFSADLPPDLADVAGWAGEA